MKELKEGVGIPVSNIKSGIKCAIFQGIWRGKFFGGDWEQNIFPKMRLTNSNSKYKTRD